LRFFFLLFFVFFFFPVELRLLTGLEDYWKAIFDQDFPSTSDVRSRVLPVHRQMQDTCARVIMSFAEAFRYSAAHPGSSSRALTVSPGPLSFPSGQDRDDRDFSSVDVNSLAIPVVTLTDSEEEEESSAAASRDVYDPPSPSPNPNSPF
jgi:hypothetical protein